MDRLFPPLSAGPTAPLDSAELERIYGYPEPLARPWVRVNFVSSLDGAVTVGGRSEGLSSAADKRLFALIRDLADVVLVGAGTAVVEGYAGVRDSEVRADRRARHGLRPLPPIAVVTRKAALPPDSGLFAAGTPTVVLTCAAAGADRHRALSDAGAEVIVCGDADVELRLALDALAGKGLRRIACEGGPGLFGSLIADDLVDELCLSLSPLLAGGEAGRIGHGPLPEAPRNLRLASVLTEDDMLFLRYARPGG